MATMSFVIVVVFMVVVGLLVNGPTVRQSECDESAHQVRDVIEPVADHELCRCCAPLRSAADDQDGLIAIEIVEIPRNGTERDERRTRERAPGPLGRLTNIDDHGVVLLAPSLPVPSGYEFDGGGRFQSEMLLSRSQGP
jgi:hypothetical protein